VKLISEFREKAILWKERIAVVANDQEITYGQLMDLLDGIKDELCHLKLKRRRLVICSHDPLKIILYVFACWMEGGIPVLLHENAPESKVRHVAETIRAAGCFYDERLEMSSKHSQNMADRMPPDECEALVLTTSGTTAYPKLVALPDESLELNRKSICADFAVTAEDRFLVPTPLSHPTGIVGGILPALTSGAQAHIFPPGTPAPILQAHIRSHNITIIQGPPAFFRLFMMFWNGKPFPPVRLIMHVGESCEKKLYEELSKAFPEAKGFMGYGMTEAGPRISHIPFEESRSNSNAIGFPFEHIE